MYGDDGELYGEGCNAMLTKSCIMLKVLAAATITCVIQS